MKIAVIGANGKAGKLIAYEAWKRGHEVTGILRDAEKAPGVRYPLMEKDLFDLKAEDLSGFDAVISAFGLPFGGDHPADAYQQAYSHLISVFGQLPEIFSELILHARPPFSGAASARKMRWYRARTAPSGESSGTWYPDSGSAAPRGPWR